MSSIVKPLYELIKHSLTCYERLEPYKLTQRQAGEVFVWLDHRRRGSVDISDFYNKFSDLTQGELFYVFQFFDVSMKQAFTHQDLQVVLSTKMSMARDPQDDSIRSFTNLVRILRATFHLIQQQKKRLGIKTDLLQKIFDRATLGRKEKLDMTDLVVLFKQAQLQLSQRLLIYLRTKVFTKATLNVHQFVHIFSQFTWDQSSYKEIPLESRTNVRCHQIEATRGLCFEKKELQRVKSTDNVNISQIDRILLKYKTPNMEQLNISEAKYKEISTKKQPDQYAKKQMDRYRHLEDTDQIFNKCTDNKLQNLFNCTSPTNFTHTQINKRRQQLRRGSIQRQRIIDDVMNRKKYEGLINKPGTLYSHNLKLNQRQEKNQIVAGYRTSTPTSKLTQQRSNIESTLNARFYSNLSQQQQKQTLLRPSSANKTASNGFLDRSSLKVTQNYHASRPDMSQFFRRAETPKNFTYQKQNILKKAEQQATRKIQQIQRRARLKVMEKRTTAGIYNRWIK